MSVTSGRKIEDEAEARRCPTAAKRKGLRVGDWARAHDIYARSLNAWRTATAKGKGGGDGARIGRAYSRFARARHRSAE